MTSSITRNLARIDLNLLVTMDVLLRELNVTRAAKEMHITQSAMSYALQRLRDTFDDPLFTRVSRGLVPTQKALAIGQELPHILQQLNVLIDPPAFDPKECRLTFSVALPSMLSTLVTPKIVNRLIEEAPFVNLAEHPTRLAQAEAIKAGTLDFAVHYEVLNDPNYIETYLGDLKASLFARKEHPIFKSDKIDAQETTKYPFLGLQLEPARHFSFDAPIDMYLSSLKQSGTVKVRGVQTQVLVDIMLQSNSLFFTANALKMHPGFGKEFDEVQSLDNWGISLYLIQHSRNRGNDAYTWFEKMLGEELSELINLK
ncbi:LysR family transcriptional regulator [Vibrio breoganii]